MKRWMWIVGVSVFIIALLFICRYSILRSAGNLLIKATDPEKSEVIFVLSGSPVDRGLKAAELYKEGWANKLICTGGNRPKDFEALGLEYYESQLTKSQIVRSGVPDSAVQVISKGTSTTEESDVVLNYCIENNIHSCIIVSSAFHTRRVYNVFKNKLEEKKIKTTICGAPSTVFHEHTWWENEYGLLTVNNEYVKMVYYWFK